MRLLSFFLLIPVCFLTTYVQAQERKLNLGITPGLMYYMGDLKETPFPQKGFNHFSIGIDVGYRLGKPFNITLGYSYGKISGADSLVPGREKRNLQFKSNISDFRLLFHTDVLALWRAIRPGKLVKRHDWRRKLTGPDIILGVGYLHFNPKGYADGTWHELQPLGTEGQNIGDGYPSPYKLWQFNYKYGLGLGYFVGRQLHLQLEGLYTVTFTDYLDDVSGNYPDYDALLDSESGELASVFTYGGRDGDKIRAGNSRGNPAKKDGYVYMGLRVTYYFNRDEVRRILHL